MYSRYFESKARGFIDILLYCKSKQVSHERLVETVHKVSVLCPGDVSVDKVIALLGNQPPEIMSPEAQPGERNEIEDLSMQQLQEITRLAEGSIN